MKIGHVFLDKLPGDDFQRFVLLLEALGKHGLEQYAIVRHADLARRLANCEGLTVGYAVRSPVLAYCMMPFVEVAHVHGERSAETGLLLTLTRSIPYVITRHCNARQRSILCTRSVYRRAAGIICRTDAEALLMLEYAPESPVDVISPILTAARDDLEALGQRSASEHLRVYRRVVAQWQIPTLLL